MHDDLQQKGLKPGEKSTTLRFPDSSILPGNLQKDFIRGFFDGDGCVTQYARKRGDKGYDFAIIGNRQFLEKVKEIMERDCKVNKVNLLLDHRTLGTYRLRYGGPKNLGKIFEYLYGKNGNPDNQICMRRKYEKMKEAYDYFKESINERRIIDEEILSYDMAKAVEEKPLTISELASRLNHKRSTIKKFGLVNPDLELVFPDGKNSVFRIRGQDLKDHIYPEKYSDKVLEKYLMKSQINAFKRFTSAGLYDYNVKRSYADIGKRTGQSADNVKQQATRIKERLLSIPRNELQ